MSTLPPRMSVEERARKYLSMMPPSVSGQDGHTALFNAVRVLLHGFGFSTEVARGFIAEFNQRCDPPWSESEINHKLRSVDGLACPDGRGYLLKDVGLTPNTPLRKKLGMPTETERKAKVEYDPAALTQAAGEWARTVNLLWLANRSSVDPATVSAEGFLRALYRPGEKILIFNDVNSQGKTITQGEALWPEQPVPTTGKCGVWYLPQPVDGEYHPNPRSVGKDGKSKMSRRSEESVRDYRYLVLESDEAPAREWLGFLVQAPLRIEALYTSGARSVHALVRVDCATKAAWDAEKQAMMPFLMTGMMLGADRGTWSGVRLSRLPGCWREGKYGERDRYERYPAPQHQKLLYLKPGADGRPICEMPPIRDVEADWLRKATAAVDGHEAATAELIDALTYYQPVSRACRETLAHLKPVTTT